MKVDLLYLAHNRVEFTARTLEALKLDTNWDLVNELWLYDDASIDGAGEVLDAFGRLMESCASLKVRQVAGAFGGPVAIMKHFYESTESRLFAKIDNDTAVPAGWLDVCLDVMEHYDELDLLGIEPMQQLKLVPFDTSEEVIHFRRSYEAGPHIGGIGLMRGRVFEKWGTPIPDGRFGFTQFQTHFNLKCGWLEPALPVVLLNLLPIEPWRSLSEKYIERGWQRAWPDQYKLDRAKIWEWL